MAMRRLILMGLLLASGAATAELPELKLAWSDEFSVDGRPDETKWDYERGFVRNQEWQRYTTRNAYCSNGWLVIEARKDPRLTSASVITKGKMSFGYGVLEIRAKFEAKGDLWPALWMLGDGVPDCPWPRCGEIDLFEYYDDSVLANLCWADSSSPDSGQQKWNTKKIPLKTFLAEDPEWKTKWHVWRLDRTPDHIVLSLDGKVLNSQMQAFARNNFAAKPVFPFREKMYLLMNLAVKHHEFDALEPAEYPARFLVDYVRFYEYAQSAK